MQNSSSLKNTWTSLGIWVMHLGKHEFLRQSPHSLWAYNLQRQDTLVQILRPLKEKSREEWGPPRPDFSLKGQKHEKRKQVLPLPLKQPWGAVPGPETVRSLPLVLKQLEVAVPGSESPELLSLVLKHRGAVPGSETPGPLSLVLD